MRPAQRVVGPLFGISVGLLILLAGPLLLFNPWFVSSLQSRHGVAEAFATSQAEIDRVTGDVLADLFVAGDFEVAIDGVALLDADERSHLADVSRLVRLLVVVSVGAALVAALCGTLMRGRPRRMATALLVTASVIGITGLLVGVVFAVAFEPAFLAFHAVFFPAGTYLFEPGSNLITLFPEAFWFEATLIAGLTVVLSAAAVLAVGLAGRRRPPATLAAG